MKVAFILQVTSVEKPKSKVESMHPLINICLLMNGKMYSKKIRRKDLKNISFAEDWFPGTMGMFSDSDRREFEAFILNQCKACKHETIVYPEEGLTIDGAYMAFGNELIPVVRDSPVPSNTLAVTGVEYDFPSLSDQELCAFMVNNCLSVWSVGNSTILLAVALMANLYELLSTSPERRWVQPCFTPVVVGPSGSRKTSTVQAVCLTRHGVENTFSLPNSTSAAIMQALQLSFSDLILVDDLRPCRANRTDNTSLQILKDVLRTQGDPGAGKKTARGQGRNKSMAIFTAESYGYLSEASDIFRTVLIEIEKNECNLNCLTNLQNNSGIINLFLRQFTRYFLNNECLETMVDITKENWDMLMKKYERITTNGRVLMAHAQILAFSQLLNQFFSDNGVELETRNDIITAVELTLMQSAQKQINAINQNDPDNGLKSFLHSYFIEPTPVLSKLNSVSGKLQGEDSPSAVGYLFGDKVLLNSRQKSMLIHALADSTGHAYTSYELHKKLESFGVLKLQQGQAASQKKVTINGEAMKAITIDLGKIKEWSDTDASL